MAQGPVSDAGVLTIPTGVQSIAALALASGVSQADLLTANAGLTDARFVAAQRPTPLRLRVPGAREHVVIAQGGVVETREIIARVNDVSLDSLTRANPGLNWATLALGDRVLISKK